VDELEVRLLTPDSWRIFQEVRLAALREAPHAFGSTWEREADLSEGEWRDRLSKRAQFVAISEEVVVGTIGAVVTDDGRTVDLISLWVDPHWRGRGVGDHLVKAVLKRADSMGCDEVRLWVADGNREAERLYSRNRFRRTEGVQPIRPGEPRLEFEMARKV
jgi:ribosomal protein S18 acetylase RimI-like enzyme